MNKTPFVALALALVIAVTAWGVNPALSLPAATPSLVTVGTTTTVTVTIQILDPLLIPGSVNLLRLGPPDAQPIVLGALLDDGQNGDAASGDGVFTLQVPFSERAAGVIKLQVSAVFKGALKRSLSPITTLQIQQ